MEAAFLNLLQDALPTVTVIFWDLDGTLGEQPGWNGRGSVRDYIKYPVAMRNLLHALTARGIYNVLVSRNSMFCDDEYDEVRQNFYDLGFQEVFSCYRTRKHSKVFGFTQTWNVLLIDDQEKECIEACQDGAFALHLHDMFQRAIVSGKFAIWYP